MVPHRFPTGTPLVWALLAAAVLGCRREPPIAAERIVDVTVGQITSGVLAVGRVEPRTRVEVKSKANGIIRKLHVDVNDPVAAGQVIAELDREILQSRVGEAEGKLQQARARVALARAEVDYLEIQRSDPEFEYARKNWDRVRRLFEDGITSEEERDLALERRDQAVYRERLLAAGIESARATVATAEGEVVEKEALAGLARQELEEATIVSPIDGVVLYRYLEEGDAVSSIRVAGGNATVIMTLGDLDELYVDGEVDEVDVGRIISEQRVQEDLEARVTIESYRDRVFSGRVTRITPLGLEDANGIVTFEVRIQFDNPERLLLANMTANSLIVLEEKDDVVLVSQGAILTERGERFALVYDSTSGRPRRQRVSVGLSDGSRVEIVDGLRPDQKIVLP